MTYHFKENNTRKNDIFLLKAGNSTYAERYAVFYGRFRSPLIVYFRDRLSRRLQQHTSSPLRVRVLDYADGGRQCTRPFRTAGAKDYLWQCVRAGRVEKEDEPRASWAVWRCWYPDGHKSRKDTMAGTRDEDAGLMPHQEGARQRPVRHEA